MKRLSHQLGISPQDVDTSFHKQRPFTTKEAIKGVLTNWLNRQDNRYAAYIAMGEALIHPDVGLNLIAREVLNYPPAERINEPKTGRKRKRRNRDRDQRKKLKKINELSVKP